MREMFPGKRFDRYHELGQTAFGENIGLYIVVPQQLAVQICTCIVYMVTGGKSLQKFTYTVAPNTPNIRLTYFIMIFGSVHLGLSHLPNFNPISGVSLAAAIISLRYLQVTYLHVSGFFILNELKVVNIMLCVYALSYSIIAWAASLREGIQPHVDYGPRTHHTSDRVILL